MYFKAMRSNFKNMLAIDVPGNNRTPFVLYRELVINHRFHYLVRHGEGSFYG